ncbi:MAG: DUF2934 domain-containing protein [Rhizomicrobium sp.]|nr:DUF2934 domain-containing protein [Rhizomicrobium sp.]
MKTKKSISDDIHKAIALRAYHIWEREGRPHDREQAHWRIAEAEILGEPPAEKAAVPAPAAAPKKPAKKATVAKAAPQKLDAKKPVAAKAVIAAATSKKAVKAKAAKPAPR